MARRVLVTGATGYIGGRLVPALLEAGFAVRCAARDPSRLDADPWRDDVEVVSADVLDRGSLDDAVADCEAAFYLIHAMGGGSGFDERDRRGASNFADAAEEAGMKRIVYLGGLGDDEDPDLSTHLASRHEVGRVLREGSVPVTELRAAVIIGSGSVSFEMIRYLAEVLPVMVTPRWVQSRCQPIAIPNVLEYLTATIDDHSRHDHIYEIGGPDVMTYADMLRGYAEAAGLPPRLIIPVPVLSPRLSSHWIGLVTPLPTDIAKPLVDSLRHDVVVTDRAVQDRYPVDLVPYAEALELALNRSGTSQVPTRWSDAMAQPALPAPTDPEWSGGTMFSNVQHVETVESMEDVFWAVERIGGTVGYYGFDWLWTIRGLLDVVVGGVGRRRGRRDPEELHPGETVDFWRVAAVERPRLLQLFAEMKLPGTAWLQWEVADHGSHRTLTQTALFSPKGLFGRLYWLAVTPFHVLIFGRMARRIAAAAAGRSVR